jgi:enoyl-CoA hydratase
VSDYTTIQYEQGDGVATIWLNRPDKRNALNATAFRELGAAVVEADADPEVRVILLRGRGPGFCAGGDLDMIAGDVLGQVPPSLDLSTSCADIFGRFAACSKPTVAIVHGFAVAGGFELMIACDFAIATRDARIGDGHMRRSLFGGGGPIYRLPRLVGERRARELMFTGKQIDGFKAESWGLVNVAAHPDLLEEAIEEFIEPLLQASPLAMRITKLAASRGLDAGTETLKVLEHFACSLLHQSEDAKEGIAAFLERRDPKWTGR